MPKSVSHTPPFTEKARPLGKEHLHSNRNLTLVSKIWPFRVNYVFKTVRLPLMEHTKIRAAAAGLMEE